MVLAIVGSAERFWTPDKETEARHYIRSFIIAKEPDLVISGECPKGGVDIWAREIATELGYPFMGLEPEKERWQPNGYKERNLKIAKLCSILLRVVSKTSTTYGSGWTKDRAEELGKTVYETVI